MCIAQRKDAIDSVVATNPPTNVPNYCRNYLGYLRRIEYLEILYEKRKQRVKIIKSEEDKVGKHDEVKENLREMK